MKGEMMRKVMSGFVIAGFMVTLVGCTSISAESKAEADAKIKTVISEHVEELNDSFLDISSLTANGILAETIAENEK